jgi:hypothetical protein
MAEVTVTNDGFVVPDVQTIRAVIAQLQKDINADPSLKASFELNPGIILGQRGLSLKVQAQLFQESELEGTDAGECFITGCVQTSCKFVSIGG